MKKLTIFLLFIFLTWGASMLAACTPPPPTDLRSDPVDDAIDGPNPMVHQQGMQIIDPNE